MKSSLFLVVFGGGQEISEVKNVGAAKLAALKNNLATCDDATLDRLHKHYTGAKG